MYTEVPSFQGVGIEGSIIMINYLCLEGIYFVLFPLSRISILQHATAKELVFS